MILFFMKTGSQHILLLSGIALTHCLCAYGQEDNRSDASLTNVFSLSQSDIKDETGQEESYYVNCLIHHVIMPETLPSDLDTNGNWGPQTNGLQLSLRFRDKSYALGGKVPALIILRNIETNSRPLLLTNSSSFYVQILVRDGADRYLQQRIEPAVKRTHDFSPIPSFPSGLASWEFDGKSEKALVLNLNRILYFNKTGHYTATAICRVYSPTDQSVSYEVVSGSAAFTISSAANGP